MLLNISQIKLSRPFLLFFRNSLDKGMLLVVATILALFTSNSILAKLYTSIIHSSVNFQIFSLPSHLIVNDFLMSIFFLAVGIEIKKELIDGHLTTRAQRVLPVICAICGVITPCIIYVAINNRSPENLVGWAIPTATDIAFTIAVMSIFSSKIPQSIRIFVTALAIIDDLIAVIAIAIFYTSDLNMNYLFGILVCIIILFWISKRDILMIELYILLGVILFLLFFFSGVHSTVSGVVLGLCLPRISGEKILKKIQRFVTYVVMPIFAFFNSGISLDGFSNSIIFNPVVLGISLGLFGGKQLGIFLGGYLLIKTRIAKMPENATLQDIYIASIFCGIGFTMSLFVASLAFEQDSDAILFAKIGILLGSLASCAFGSAILHLRKNKF